MLVILKTHAVMRLNYVDWKWKGHYAYILGTIAVGMSGWCDFHATDF